MDKKIGIIGSGVDASLIALQNAISDKTNNIEIVPFEDIDRGIVIKDPGVSQAPFAFTNPYEQLAYTDYKLSKPKHHNSKQRDINKQRDKNKKAKKARKINRKH